MKKLNLNLGGGATNRLKAFTLAEVLITLAIIGVVAALTIPTVVTSSRRTEIESRLKKSYAQLSQALQLAIKDYGSVAGWEFPTVTKNEEANARFAKQYLTPYLKVAKDCTNNDSADCNYKYRNLRGAEIDTGADGDYTFYLVDGTYVAVNTFTIDNMMIFVDANGHKKPNIYGYDIQAYYIERGNKKSLNGSLATRDIDFSGNSACAIGKNGTQCINLIIQNGWKIPSKEEYVKFGGDATKYPFNNL